tara:strand:+ start:374 stop:1438 length:1065 start_codon:yes stop_codon:yes gene_type:complete
MIETKKLFELSPYTFNKNEKNKYFIKGIENLTNYHKKNCREYRDILKKISFTKSDKNKLMDYPFLPVKIFKDFDLKSVPNNKIKKKLVSSGTTGQSLSKIYLDNENSNNQIKALNKIMCSILGNQRLPMLIIDHNPKDSQRSTLSARLAAIHGFSIFGKDHTYLLNKKNEIDYKTLNYFLKKNAKDKFIIFGFTSIVYENLIKKICTKFLSHNFNNAILIHGGGWKKMEKLKISNKNFKKKLFDKFKIENIYNYYGLVEQTGSIFLECKYGYFVTSIFSDILIRDEKFQLAKNGKRGLIQLLSLLPTSYPGHNILTEDIGEIIEENKCKCGLKGKHFLVHGRAKNTETRGCSDV